MEPSKKKEYRTIILYASVALILSAVIIFGFITRIDFTRYIGILSPFFYAFAIAYILDHVVKFFKDILSKLFDRIFGKKTTAGRIRTVKAIAIILSYIVFCLVLYLFSIVIFPQLYESLKDLLGNYDKYIETGYQWFRGFIAKHEILHNILYSGYFDGMLSGFADNLMVFLGDFSPKALAFVERFANEVKNILFGIFISVYMLIGKETFKAQSKKFMTAFLSSNGYRRVSSVMHECNYRFGGFIVGKIIDSTIIGIICYIGCLIFGFPFAALVSFIVGITNIIPIAGPIIGAIPSAFLILITAPEKVIWFLLFVFVLQQLDGNFIGPKILGDKTGLSAFWVLTSLIIMGGLYGIVGMVLAVPLCSVIYYEVKIIAERKLAAKDLPTSTEDYADDDEKLLVAKEKKESFTQRLINHSKEIEKLKSKNNKKNK
ncbi:MAG: AI-2E family transporter [Ruminococcaceae bacterium]|nr:AI-2E family transporter [Oscillospiraceae bacterium]